MSYQAVMDAETLEDAVVACERSEDPSGARAMLRNHWGVSLCGCCTKGYHEIH